MLRSLVVAAILACSTAVAFADPTPGVDQRYHQAAPSLNRERLGVVQSYKSQVVPTAATACTLAEDGSGCSGTTTDCGKFISFTSGSAVTVTIPSYLGQGCQVAIEQDGAGTVTVSAGSGATLHFSSTFTSHATKAQYSVVGVTVISNAGNAAIANFYGDGS